MNTERLLNVAKALRESPAPDRFTMESIHACGTPACALGHYAARPDLQSEFRLQMPYGFEMANGAEMTPELDGPEICGHFGISKQQALQLFSDSQDYDDERGPIGAGCGDAKTAIEAAEYIERFVADHV